MVAQAAVSNAVCQAVWPCVTSVAPGSPCVQPGLSDRLQANWANSRGLSTTLFRARLREGFQNFLPGRSGNGDRPDPPRGGCHHVVTIPKKLRDEYGLREGDFLTLVDLGDGSFLLSPVVSQVGQHGGRVSAIMAEAGVSLEEIEEQVDEERKRYHRQHYQKGASEGEGTERV